MLSEAKHLDEIASLYSEILHFVQNDMAFRDNRVCPVDEQVISEQ
jgi:hypothetical protein